MHIAIDGTPAINDIRAIQRYTDNLIMELSEIDHEDAFSIIYLGYKPDISSAPPKISNTNFHNVFSSIPGKLLEASWAFASFPKGSFWTNGEADLMHFPGGYAYIPTSGEKVITTIHGFLYQKHPEFADPNKSKTVLERLEKTIKLSNHFITVSETNKKELEEIFSIKSSMITAIPLGIGKEFRKYDLCREDRVSIMRKYSLPEKDFLLYVGSIEPNKNIQGILTAYSKLPLVNRNNFNLVLVGGKTAYLNNYVEQTRLLGIQDQVIFIDYINPASHDLAYLYNLAKLFIFPSFYEGWASPPLESMKCGTPALVSDIPSLKESTGGTACYCNPKDPDDISQKIKQMLEDKALYESFRKKGLDFTSGYTWRRCAESTLQLYKNIDAK
ncbi:MAG TPA: hypothetical protein DCZ94_07650 [Lentisphaeria bacterium]|nr:MAG: hypothetical protein A2X48_14330 [Lentisphaerae bacterium GWF2_49_21]HBC86811.1 hypothetical protein [Lentisphaeria bacterium]